MAILDFMRRTFSSDQEPETEPEAPDAPKPAAVRKSKGKKPDPSYATDRLARAARSRMLLEQEWLRNKAFIRGEQWLDHDVDGRLVRELKGEWKKHCTINLLYNHRRVLVSKRIAQNHVPFIVPTTSEEEDRAKARTQEALLKWVLRESDYEQERVYHETEVIETGSSWWRVDWNEAGGSEQQVSEEARQAARDEGIPDSAFEAQSSGTIGLRSVSPFEMYVEPGALRLQDARWLVHAQWMHVDEVYERWDKRVPPDRQSGLVVVSPYESSLDDAGRKDAEDMVQVVEFWQRPNKDYPKGLYVVQTKTEILDHDAELDEWHFPFVYCPYDPDPDAYHGTTPITHAVEVARELNQNVAMILEGRNHSIFPAIMEPTGCKLTERTGRPSEYLSYNESAGRPWVLGVPPVSEQIFQITGMFKEFLDQVAGNSESSMGIMPAGAGDSGRAIAFAAEKDEVKLAGSSRVYKSATKQLFVLILKMLRKYGRGKMLVPVLGANAASDIEEFELSDISFRDVDIFVDESMPTNPSAKREQALMFLQAGAITQEQFGKILELGEDQITTSRNPIRERARRENRMLYTPEMFSAEMFEDHAIHLSIHLDEMNQARWYSSPEDVKERFKYHLQEHLMLMQGMPAGDSPTQAEQDHGGMGAVDPAAMEVPGQGDVPVMPVSPAEEANLKVINGQTAQ